jgi:hypothetical protein
VTCTGTPACEASLNSPPRFRFSVKRMMVVVAGVALMLAYLANGSTKLGCGSITVNLTFQLVDDRNGKPIAGAKVELWNDLSAPPTASVVTGTDGYARAACTAGCTSYSGPFFRQYRCLSFGEGLRIGAPGYQPVDALIRDYATDLAFHNTPSPPPIMVRMKRRP